MNRRGKKNPLKLTHLLIVAALSGAVIALPATAQDNTAAPKDAPHTQNVSPLDRKFVTEASQANIAEVDAGKLALQKASGADVKAFAQKMVDDHTKAGAELASAANKAGLTPEKETDPAHRSAANTLSGLSGKAFDKAYIAMQYDDHKKAVALFKDEAAKGGNPDLKEFAGKTVPTLEQHLKHVEGVKSGNGY